MQVSQADVKLFFESVCGEVCDFMENLKYSVFFSFFFLVMMTTTVLDSIHEDISFSAGLSSEAAG